MKPDFYTKKQNEKLFLSYRILTDDVKQYSHQSISLNLNLTNIFLNQNKGKGPPGQQRSPGYFPEHPPDEVATPDRVSNPVGGKSHIFNSIQFLKTINSNFLSQLNFTKMKKQILFLAFFLLAILAGISGASAQTVDQAFLDALPASCPVPTPLTNCGVGDPIHPVAGVTYNYKINQTGGAGATVRWFVADETTELIKAGAIAATIDPSDGSGKYVLYSATAAYNQVATTADNIDISWKAFDGATTNVVLVAFVTDGAGCTNNIQAWKIEPKYSFILEIAGLKDDGTVFPASGATKASECVSMVQSAVLSGSNITMDYGDNYIFYEVTAANFIHGWTPSFSAAILPASTSTLGTIEWAYADEANAGTATNWHAATDPVLAAHYTASVVNDAIGANGACIVLRVNVDHGAIEVATAGETVEMTVDGLMWNAATSAYDAKYPDLDDAASGPCAVGSNDKVIYDITPRPDITPNTPIDPFVNKN